LIKKQLKQESQFDSDEKTTVSEEHSTVTVSGKSLADFL